MRTWGDVLLKATRDGLRAALRTPTWTNRESRRVRSESAPTQRGTGGYLGEFDPKGRPSEVRLDRVMMFDPSLIRREGAKLDRVRFNEVAAELRRLHGWPA